MLITRLGAVASQQPLPMIDAEHAAAVGGLSMAANVDPTLSATYAASVDGLTFGASLDDHEIAMFAANVEGLTFAANVAPIVGVTHAANVGGLVFGASGQVEDTDAFNYLNAVEEADEQPLEAAVRAAINAFVVGCKADGIWTPIKASCILAGARTLDGALVPLVGSAPTNFNFGSADYSRKTGLKGDGATKYLNSNRNNNADPQNSKHGFVWATEVATSPSATNLPNSYPVYIGAGGGDTGAFNITKLNNNEHLVWRNHNSSALGNSTNSPGNTAGAIGTSRYSSTQYTVRVGTTQTTFDQASQAPASGNLLLYTESSLNWNNGRLSFYSIGESLDLALLGARVSSLMTALNSAIP